jgi:hypothetical protein
MVCFLPKQIGRVDFHVLICPYFLDMSVLLKVPIVDIDIEAL